MTARGGDAGNEEKNTNGGQWEAETMIVVPDRKYTLFVRLLWNIFFKYPEL